MKIATVALLHLVVVSMMSTTTRVLAFSQRRIFIPPPAAFAAGRRNKKQRSFSSPFSPSWSSLSFENNGQEPITESQHHRQQQQQQPKNNNSNKFVVTAPYQPSADQPNAIQGIVERVNNGDKFSILRGCTGTGKTMVMAHCIAKLGKPTLVLCHNKTLAAQLARELRSFLRKNHVQLFVSYYNHYVPESYSEVSGRYVSKKSSVNDELDALRHMATRSLVQHRDVVVVASVSCIYGLGMPKSYLDASFTWTTATIFESIHDASDALEAIQYENTKEMDTSSTGDLLRGQYELSVMGNSATIVLWPPSEQYPIRIDFKSSGSSSSHWRITQIAMGTNHGMNQVPELTIFPAKHHITNSEDIFREALRRIQDECTQRCEKLRNEGKQEEADRLQKRVANDVVLLKESGTCPGVENYSRHFNLREAGEAPDTLLDYFGLGRGGDVVDDKKWMLMIDESHVTLPQLRAMYAGDQARKKKLIKHGYRLPSALDNRPLREDEFWERVPQTVFVSATPSPREFQVAESCPVDMTIRPTFVPDPVIERRPTQSQLEDLLKEIQERAKRKERTLALALTKKDAEDLSTFLTKKGVLSDYIHSGLKTHERSNALKSLQEGKIDCLVGVNILREGLDLPQVSLVAILNADTEGFLRSETALIQMVGRAARNINGKAILYANRETKSMRACMEETHHRRKIQLDYNQRYGKEMQSTAGSSMLSIFEILKDQIQAEQPLEVVVTDRPEIPSLTPSIIGSNETTSVTITRSRESLILTDHVPTKPGVYFWKDDLGKILYIGKAKRLRSRVKSYLAPGAKHSQRINAMLKRARQVEFLLTPSERDALLLESNLIKLHQPIYNVLLKDDTESYPYICATVGDDLPSFSLVPRKLTASYARNYKYFGPYPNVKEINEVLQAIESKYELRAKNFQARFGDTTKAEYNNTFFQALNDVFLSPDASSKLPALRSEYEEASTLFAHIHNAERDVVSIITLEDGVEALVHILQLRNGLVSGQFSYSCKIPVGISGTDDLGSLIQTVLLRKHYPQGDATRENIGRFPFFPKEILVQYPLPDAKYLRSLFRSHSQDTSSPPKISIRTPAKSGGRKATDKRAMEFAIQNAEEVIRQRHFENIDGAVKTSVDGTASQELAKLLSLDNIPNRIEAYDISHTQGDAAVGSRVVFEAGEPIKQDYRIFNIKTVEGVNDYDSIEEVLERRFRKAWINGEGGLVSSDDPWKLPDLVVIDGGKGQLGAALKGMNKANIFASNTRSDNANVSSMTSATRSATVPIVSLAKNLEEVFSPDVSEPINQSPDSAALLLLRSIRDESHRFALSAHRKRRSKFNGLKP